MGTPLPPNKPGVVCSNVFGVGKPFGTQVQPRYVQMLFSGYSPGSNWNQSNESALMMEQTLIQLTNPCQYELIIGNLQFFFWWLAGSTLASILDTAAGAWYFQGDESYPGALIINNELSPVGGNGAYGGYVQLDWDRKGLE